MEVFTDVFGVEGLVYVRNLLTAVEERDTLAAINAAPWDATLARRVQHYGYRYHYKQNRGPQHLGPLPAWSAAPLDALRRAGVRPWGDQEPDQMIVNEYTPGQGIAAHTDHVRQFADGIVSVSLGSPVAMEFKPRSGGPIVSVCLEPRSAAVLTGAARYRWTHEIRKRKRDRQTSVVGGGTVDLQRAHRVSVTYRKLA